MPTSPQSSGLGEQSNGIIENQLAKVTQTNLSWPKALPLALLMLQSTPASKCQLSPFEIVTGWSVHLDQEIFSPAQLQEGTLGLLPGACSSCKDESLQVVESFYSFPDRP